MPSKARSSQGFSRIVGRYNWLGLVLKLTTQELSLVFQNLGGDTDPSSQCCITFEAGMALAV